MKRAKHRVALWLWLALLTMTLPLAHARWIGSRLARLTDKQLHDAFRAADYDKATAEGYVRVLRSRIEALARV